MRGKYNIPIVAAVILDWEQWQAKVMAVNMALYVFRLKLTNLRLTCTYP